MGTRGIWLELFENLMKTKGFWWVIDGNKRNLIGTIWELGENKRILMGYWQEQEEFDWNYLRTWWKQKVFWWVVDGNKRNLIGTIWELDENKRILMGYWWEQEESDRKRLRTWWEQKDFDGLLMGTRGIWWELFERIWWEQWRGIEPAHSLKKLRNIPWGHVDATQLALLACFILMFFLGRSHWGRCCPCMKLSLTNCQGQGDKIRWSS
jgi:hypothetical protein